MLATLSLAGHGPPDTTAPPPPTASWEAGWGGDQSSTHQGCPVTIQTVLNVTQTALVIDTAGHLLGSREPYLYDDATITPANFAILQAHLNNGRLRLLTGGVTIPSPSQGASFVAVAIVNGNLVFTDSLGGTSTVALPTGDGDVDLSAYSTTVQVQTAISSAVADKASTTDLATGLATKVNSSTYTAGLAGVTQAASDAASAASAANTVATTAQTLAQKITTKPVNVDDVGYDLILCMGQSNMAGRGTTYDSRLDISDPRIVQYGDPSASAYASTISLAVDPLAHHEATGSTKVGPAVAFARRYSQRIPTNRKVMLVPTAHGDTGFQTTSLTPGTNQRNPGVAGGGTWTPTGGGVNHYTDTVATANAALAAAGSNSRIVAALWVQGEADATTGSVLSQAAYSAALDNLISKLRTDLATPNLPFIVGGMVPEFIAGLNSTATAANAAAINAAHVDTPNRVDYSSFAGPGPSAMQQGDNIHFNAAAQRIIGVKMYDAYVASLTNAGTLPPVAPTSVTLTQASATTVTASWPRPTGRVTGYDVAYTVNGGTTWIDVTRADQTAMSETITVSSGATVSVRVRSKNTQGVSAWTTSAALTLVAAPAQVTGLTAGATTYNSQGLTWSSAANATTYRVEYKRTADATWTVSQTVSALAATVTGLVGSTGYDYRVTGLNGSTAGTPSATVSATTSAPPAGVRPSAAPTTTDQPVEWLRADQITGVSNGGAVSSWPAAVGTSAAVVTQNSGTAPTLITSALAGQPAVSFNKASNQKMSYPNGGLGKNKSFLAVVRVPDLTTAGAILNGVTSADATAAGGLRVLTQTTGAVTATRNNATGATAATTATSALAANTWALVRGQFSSGGTPRVALNGTLGTDGVAGSVTDATVGFIAIGGYGTGTTTIDYAEIIGFDAFLSDADIRQWEQYLATTYGLTIATA